MKIVLILIIAMLAIGCTKEEIRTTVTTGATVYSIGYEMNRMEYCALSDSEKLEYLNSRGITEGHYSCDVP